MVGWLYHVITCYNQRIMNKTSDNICEGAKSPCDVRIWYRCVWTWCIYPPFMAILIWKLRFWTMECFGFPIISIMWPGAWEDDPYRPRSILHWSNPDFHIDGVKLSRFLVWWNHPEESPLIKFNSQFLLVKTLFFLESTIVFIWFGGINLWPAKVLIFFCRAHGDVRAAGKLLALWCGELGVITTPG